MFSFILLNHHDGKKRDRENLKRKLVNNEDISQVKALLDSLVAEHDNYRNNAQTDLRTEIDSSSLHHAQDHIKHAEEDEIQKQSTIEALEEGDT